jgi:hypothetical protein
MSRRTTISGFVSFWRTWLISQDRRLGVKVSTIKRRRYGKAAKKSIGGILCPSRWKLWHVESIEKPAAWGYAAGFSVRGEPDDMAVRPAYASKALRRLRVTPTVL